MENKNVRFLEIRGRILQIISFPPSLKYKELNLKKVSLISGFSYLTIRRHINHLEDEGLVVTEKRNGLRGGIERIIKLKENENE